MNSFFVWPLLLFLMQSRVASADNDTFEADCEKLTGSGKVMVMYTDVVPVEDSSHTIRSLQSLSGKANDAHHSVFGMTHAEPEFHHELRPKWRVGRQGSVCMVLDVSVTLWFSGMRVYLARELQDNCRKNIVREHELEHVAAWRSHFRIGAKMLEDPLRAAFSKPRYYESKTQAQADLKPWVEAVMTPLRQQLVNGAVAAQRAIDSPSAYQQVSQRLRACPPAPTGR